MLRHLYIKNFALIDELDIDFEPGFSVITGETGAGKSIILGAISLLLGNRADARSVKEGSQKCIIEAELGLYAKDYEAFFTENDIDCDSDTCTIRREVNANGKSRAFINDTPVTLNILKELGEQLIDIHSQHQNLLIKQNDFQLSVVDTIAKNAKVLATYNEAYDAFRKNEKKLAEALKSIETLQADAEYTRFRLQEIAELHLETDEQEQLEQRQDIMQHAEDIKEQLYKTTALLGDEDSGALKKIHQSNCSLSSIATLLPDCDELLQRLDSCYIELKDINDTLEDRLSEIDFDPSEMERVSDRLSAIYSLEKKHKVNSVDDLLAIQHKLEEQLRLVDNQDDTLEELRTAVEIKKNEATMIAKKLTEQRQKAAKEIVKIMETQLKLLGLPNVRFEVTINTSELTASGADNIELLFSANPGSPLRPIADIASGGEIARVMLSLKSMLSGATKLPTIIFDEIDTGVSGRIAEQMGCIMRDMCNQERQVISITHLPQIAALGTSHYKVEKTQTSTITKTIMKLLGDEDRVREIAQMLSGSDISEAAITNAKELLKK